MTNNGSLLDELKPDALTLILFTIFAILLTIVYFPSMMAFGQEQQSITNDSCSNLTNNPIVAEQVAAQTTPIAQDADISNQSTQMQQLIAAVGTPLAGGIAALFGKLYKDKQKIDHKLREIDYDKKAESEAWMKLLENAAKDEHKDLTFFQLLNLPLHPGNSLDKTTIGQNIIRKNQEFAQWFEGRYKDNPE